MDIRSQTKAKGIEELNQNKIILDLCGGNHNVPEKHPCQPNGALVSSGHGRKLQQITRAAFNSWTGGSASPDKVIGIVDHLKELPADCVPNLPPSPDRAALRSITPPGFARAFFEANK